MREPNYFGRCAMSIKCWLICLVGLTGYLGAGLASGDPVSESPVDPEAEAAYQLEVAPAEQDWRLDPTVFVDISPVSVPEVAIKLPDDQRDGG